MEHVFFLFYFLHGDVALLANGSEIRSSSPSRMSHAKQKSSLNACSTMPKTPKWAQMLGAEFSHGRRVQQLMQEESPRRVAIHITFNIQPGPDFTVHGV